MHALLRDADVAGSDERHLFWAGLLFGAAGAAAISFMLGGIDVAASYRRNVTRDYPPGAAEET